MPRLVITSAYPRSGKSTIACYLQELGFVRIGSDPMREMLTGKTAAELVEGPDFEQKEYGLVWPAIDYLKKGLLRADCDVIVDASAVYNGMRRWLLDTTDLDVEKYLIVLRTGWDEIVRRELARSGDIGYLTKLAGFWEESAQDLDCRIIEYESNTEADLSTQSIRPLN